MDAGGTLIDVSPSSADAISQVSRHEVVLSAQVGVRPERPAGQRVDCSRRSLLAQLDELLASLGTDHIDLLSVGHFDARTPVDEIANTLDYAVRSGRARYAGVRGYNAWQLAVTPGVIAAQREYSLLRRGPEEELLPAASHLGAGFVAENPLAHGVLSGRPHEPEARTYIGSTIVDAVATAAEGLGVSLATVSLAWVLKRVDAAVVKVSNPAQVKELAAATELPKSIDKALEDVSRVG